MDRPPGNSDETDEEDSEYGVNTYPLHDAAERPDATQLQALLQVRDDDSEFFPGLPDEGLDLNTRDRDGCTPLHVALLSGSLECLRVLLDAGADVAKLCEGSPVLHIAVSVGSFSQQQAFSSAAVLLLLQHSAVPYERDDHGRTALHWAAAHGLVQEAKALLLAAENMRTMQQTMAADGISAEISQNAELPRLEQLQDKQGNTPLHLAAFHRQAGIIDLLLSDPTAQSPAESQKQGLALAMTANRAGILPIHAAAIAGCLTCCLKLYMAASASPDEDMLLLKDKRGLTAAAYAVQQGNETLANLLTPDKIKTVAPLAGGAPDSSAGLLSVKPTLVVAPTDCFGHRTCPEPIVRDGPDIPPENVNRLKVLTDPATGILRSSEFSTLQWDETSRQGCMADILRVHEWSYVRSLQHMCASIPDIPAVVGHLDGDTAISNGTFRAALAAVGGICNAVDRVVKGEVRNAFCAIRPPGHHAGPTGVVACANDPTGSHGFCLLNNLAIAAAYAMNAHRHAGIKRVALLDFDVHHGNGTEACVAATAPSLRKFSFKTPFSEGSQTFPTFSPWLDTDDAENILFASVQGYGQKAPGIGAFVYPGSGATCDTRPASAGHAIDPNSAQPSGMSTTEEDDIVEDPDNEFGADTVPQGEGPRIINVGIPGPGAHVPMWKRAWRDKILPAVARFKPDIIFISAGFDAHKKDDINFRYIGIQEKEFEWLTEQLVSLANKYCQGRIVSALEGGYRIQGGVVSAFARSVASHVRALSAPTHAQWSWDDVKAEQQREKQRKAQLAEQERQKLLKTQATKYAQHQAGLAAAAAATQSESPATNPQLAQATQDTTMPAADAPAIQAEEMSALHVASPGGADSETSGRKRRRTTVDYVALNKQLEAEAAGPSRQSGSQQEANAPDTLSFVTDVPAIAVGVQASNAVPNQRPDTPLDKTALNVGQDSALAQQPHEGDRLL